MALRQEEYRAEVTATIPARRVGDDSINGVMVLLPSEKGRLEVALESPTITATTLRIIWTFTDWFNEDSGQSFSESSWDLWERSGVLFIPDEAGKIDFSAGIAVGEVLRAAVLPYLARLALASRSPYFWSRVRDINLHAAGAEIRVAVAGRSARLHAQSWSLLPEVRSSPLDVSRARIIAATPFPEYATFLLTADRRFMDGDYRDAVVHLAQGLEVAAYAFVRRFVPSKGGSEWNFTVPKYFGPPKMRRPEIASINSSALSEYPALCELAGARHEWVHEGRSQVRPFDSSAERASSNPSTYRDLVPADYYRFRRAVSTALVWMGEAPIE